MESGTPPEGRASADSQHEASARGDDSRQAAQMPATRVREQTPVDAEAASRPAANGPGRGSAAAAASLSATENAAFGSAGHVTAARAGSLDTSTEDAETSADDLSRSLSRTGPSLASTVARGVAPTAWQRPALSQVGAASKPRDEGQQPTISRARASSEPDGAGPRLAASTASSPGAFAEQRARLTANLSPLTEVGQLADTPPRHSVDDSRSPATFAAPATDAADRPSVDSLGEPPTYVPRGVAAGARQPPNPDDLEAATADSEVDAHIPSDADRYSRSRRRGGGMTHMASARSGGSDTTRQQPRFRFHPRESVRRSVQAVVEALSALVLEPPLVEDPAGVPYWEYFADSLRGVESDGEEDEDEQRPETTAAADAKGPTAASRTRRRRKSPYRPPGRPHMPWCGGGFGNGAGCRFSLRTCALNPYERRRRFDVARNIYAILSPRSWLIHSTLHATIGLATALLLGVVLPIYAFLFRNVVDAWADYMLHVNMQSAESLNRTAILSFLAVTLAATLLSFLHYAFLGAISRRVRNRLRLWSFTALLQTNGIDTDRLDRYLYDYDVLGQVVTVCSQAVDQLANILTYGVQLIASVVIGLVVNWAIYLVLIASTPLLALVGLLYNLATSRRQQLVAAAVYESQSYLASVRASLPTVALSNQHQKEFVGLYHCIERERLLQRRLTLMEALVRSLSYLMVVSVFFVIGVYMGGHLSHHLGWSVGSLVVSMILALLTVSSAMKMAENAAGYRDANEKTHLFLDFVLELVDESQLGLGTLFRVDERNMRVAFVNVSCTADGSSWTAGAPANAKNAATAGSGSGSGSSGDSQPAKAAAAMAGGAAAHARYAAAAGKGVSGGRAPRYLLFNVSLTVEHHQTHAIVVRRRRHEQLLLELLSGKRRPDEGDVLLGEHRLHDYSPAALAAAMGLVPLRGRKILPGATIFDNITYGSMGASFTEVRAAAMTVGLHEVILRTPDGYQTVLQGSDEDGAQGTFTPTQVQALSLARALLKNPGLLVLDSATYSALMETTVGGAALDIKSICRGRTVIFVLHANVIEELYFTDVISVIEDGRVAEQGTHHALMERRNGRYGQMVRANLARDTNIDDDDDDDDDDDSDDDDEVEGKGRDGERVPETV